ncbi:unnamed protein product [Schistosoma rodhaini]|uniref:mTERF domain-containing protein 2 n=1 Tax=Schistosoma rodhaini TaxID=6188 RepID=A0A183QWZ6_9TREM|nr:unnamed protein product [Schistosoma rodhaini]
MHYRQCCTFFSKIFLNHNFKTLISHRNQNVFFCQIINNNNNNRFSSSLTSLIQLKHSLSTISSQEELFPTWITSKYLPNDWLQKEFSDPFALNNFKNLIVLCQNESKLGRWRTIKSLCSKDNDETNDPESLLDSLFLNVYQKELNIDARTGIQMIHNVCKYRFSEQNVSSQYNQHFDPLHIRLDMLNCDIILSKLYDPLYNIGVKHVNKLIERCPDLPLSTMICSIDMPDSNYNESNKNTSLFQKTILQQSLEVLMHYLIHKDVVNVVQRFPSVLLRGRSELVDICEFCIDDMSLESYDYVNALSSPTHKHSLRHSTGLCISKCPIWELSFDHVRARYIFLRLVGCWPLARRSLEKTINVDQQLADLLKSTPGQFTQWLNNNLLNSSSSKSKTNRKKVEKYTVPNDILFTKSDIQLYEEIYSHLITNSDNIDDSGDVNDDKSLKMVSNCDTSEL